MKTAIRVVFVLLLEAAYLSLAGAQPLSPKRLNTDPNLAALIAVRGQFTSLLVDEQQALTLPVWAADFSPNEQVDFEQLVSRSFSQLELPEQPGWGLFEPAGQHLEIQVRVTDQQGRLGRVEFRDPDTWQLIASIWANAIRTEVSGVFSIPADRREMVAEVLNDVGRVLVRMAVDVGKFDTVVPVPVVGNFDPYRFEPVYCPHISPHPDDVFGQPGDPYCAPGHRSGVTVLGRSHTTLYKDFVNDARLAVPVDPPNEIANLFRKKTIYNSVFINQTEGQVGPFKVGDPKSMAELVQTINNAAAQDSSCPVSSVQAAPYSESCAKWRLRFTGEATAVLAIPYERKKRQPTLSAFLSAINTLLAPRKEFLSVLVASAANVWLQDEQNAQASGLKPGEVVAIGDVYSVSTDSAQVVVRDQNLTQEWQVFVKARFPDGTEAPTAGTVTIERVEPDIQPSPPQGPVYYQILVPPEGRRFLLGKGWRYRFLVDGTEQCRVAVPADGNPPTVTLYKVIVPPSGR